MIAESTKKTDRLDAQVLTEFLVLDMIPESYQPTPRQRQHRALVRHRQYLQGRITSVRSKIRHILSNSNADRKDLFSANCGPAYLKEVRLSDVDRLVMKQLWAEWQDHLAQRLAVSKKLKAFVAKAPQREAEARELLKTAPGVGPVTAEVVLSELGDISRFRNAKTVCAYAGLVPVVRQSGERKSKDLKITKEGSGLLRWASAVYLRIAGANNSIVGDAKVFLTRPWIRRRLAMGPYSMDLRERVAAVIDEGEGSQRQVAKRFRVSVSFVTRLLQRRRDAGTLAPKPHGGGPRPVLGFPEQVRLAMLIAEHPDATLNQLKERGGFACTLTTIWRTLRRFRLTFKKKTLHASERDDPKVQAKRRRYRRKVEQMDAKRLVFVDETGINTAMTPTHAWARRGKRAIGSVPTSWGSTTVIAALGLDGVRAPLVFPGATDTQAFQTYVDEVLAPELHPGDVVIFDNLKPHLAPHVAESIERAGASVLPLPPYSSDYDPIEELWSKFKGELRRVAARVRNDLYNAVGETLDHVTLQDILGWFNHSGLYATHA